MNNKEAMKHWEEVRTKFLHEIDRTFNVMCDLMESYPCESNSDEIHKAVENYLRAKRNLSTWESEEVSIPESGEAT